MPAVSIPSRRAALAVGVIAALAVAGCSHSGAVGGSSGDFDPGLKPPRFESEDAIVVADSGNSAVDRVASMSGDGWRSAPVGAAIVGVFLDSLGRIWLCDGPGCRIGRMDGIDGSGLAWFGSAGAGVGQFQQPSRVFVDGLGHIYVADTGNDRIVRLDDLTGLNWLAFGSAGNGVGQFASPRAVIAQPDGTITVADTGNDRLVQMTDLAGTAWTSYGASGAGVGQFSAPVAVWPHAGCLYVVDEGNQRLVRIAGLTGAGWTTYGDASVWTDPVGLFVAADGGHIYVVDRARAAITRMADFAGSGFVTLGSAGSGIDRFQQPMDVQVLEVPYALTER